MTVIGPKNCGPPHGVYDEKGERLDWDGRILTNPNTGAPMLDPPLRLGRNEQVFAWWEGELMCIFSPSGPVDQSIDDGS